MNGYRFDRLKIMVVDDNPHMRKLVVTVLQAFGAIQIFEAADAERAWPILNFIHRMALLHAARLACCKYWEIDCARALRITPYENFSIWRSDSGQGFASELILALDYLRLNSGRRCRTGVLVRLEGRRERMRSEA